MKTFSQLHDEFKIHSPPWVHHACLASAPALQACPDECCNYRVALTFCGTFVWQFGFAGFKTRETAWVSRRELIFFCGNKKIIRTRKRLLSHRSFVSCRCMILLTKNGFAFSSVEMRGEPSMAPTWCHMHTDHEMTVSYWTGLVACFGSVTNQAIFKPFSSSFSHLYKIINSTT